MSNTNGRVDAHGSASEGDSNFSHVMDNDAVVGQPSSEE